VPSATFGAFDTFSATVPTISYDVDRGQALDGLAKVAGAFWYPLAGGDFVLRAIPWTVPVKSSGFPLTNVGGTLLAAFPLRSRAGVYSRVTVSNEPADGSAPFYATVDDLDPTSPTYVNGAYGVKATQLRITQAVSQGTCFATAQTQLRHSRALTESWSLTCVADGSIELGDVANVLFRDRFGVDRITRQVVAGYTLPLDLHQTMTIDGRDPVAGGVGV